MRTYETKNEHTKHCEDIIHTIQMVFDDELYICPECGEIVDLYGECYDWQYEEKGIDEHAICTECGYDDEGRNDWELLDVYKYFEGSIYTLEKEGNGYEMCFAWGNPWGYINTNTKEIRYSMGQSMGKATIPDRTNEQLNWFFNELTV